MNVNSVNRAGYTPPVTQANNKAEAAGAEEKYSAAAANTDTFVKSEETAESLESVTYTPPKKLTAEQIGELKRQVLESIQSLASKMLGAQYKIAKNQDGSIDFKALAESLGIGTTPETAAAAISEDGMWGVDAVSTRLIDFAMGLSGGDPEKIAELREAVTKGFEAVGDISSLPQVCQDTYAETMARFDYWEANGTLEGYGESEEAAGEE